MIKQSGRVGQIDYQLSIGMSRCEHVLKENKNFIFVGTYLGSLVLNRLPARVFAIGLKTILTVLSINLLASALGLFSLL